MLVASELLVEVGLEFLDLELLCEQVAFLAGHVSLTHIPDVAEANSVCAASSEATEMCPDLARPRKRIQVAMRSWARCQLRRIRYRNMISMRLLNSVSRPHVTSK